MTQTWLLLSIKTSILPPSICPSHIISSKRCIVEKKINLKNISLGEINAYKFSIFVCYVYGFESRSVYFPIVPSLEKHWDRNNNGYIITICRVFNLWRCQRVSKSAIEVGFWGNPTCLRWHGWVTQRKLRIFILNMVNDCVLKATKITRESPRT
jgi:hypothetical protein